VFESQLPTCAASVSNENQATCPRGFSSVASSAAGSSVCSDTEETCELAQTMQ
jgi:hypothetical protein